ncbi:MAG: hypothetical protein INH41_06270 [Myxococcaceae bacterium]|nr:hypothetical protein [Myxococcaceae bacterium]MCA3011993.1 hypothetical protein [Myxococcaceae bacterium]
MTAAWLVFSLLAAGPASDELPRQTLVFYNARLAQRAKRPADVLTLWLLRNALVDAGLAGRHDGAFRSLVWAATGALGLCQDGLAKDDGEGGAGLWPLALHNHVLLARQPEELPQPYDAFEVGRQQRLVSLSDVLSDEELQSVTFSQTDCLAPRLALFEFGQSPLLDLEDREVQGLLMKRLLERALKTVERRLVTSTAVIEARRFDLDLALAELKGRRKREAALDQAERVRAQAMSATAAKQAGQQAASALTDPGQQAFLRRALTWRPDEWLTLSRQRRTFLFSKARPEAADAAAAEALALGIVDALVAQEAGDEVTGWLGFLTSDASREAAWDGPRGERLLALAEATGFKERAVIALHRGVRQLERGVLADALRSFAFALAHSSASRDAAAVHPLARRWLSYVLSRYQATTEALSTLKALVPRQDFNPVIEALAWAAALRADAPSFDRIAASAQKGSAFDARLLRLELLAHGKPAELVAQLQGLVAEAPFETLRFTRQLVDSLEREEAPVRRANVGLLQQLVTLMDGLASRADTSKASERLARELAGRAQAMLEALGASAGTSAEVRALALGHSAFAGSLRLAPSDPLPWPFSPPEVEAPPVFTPLQLVPMEWRDAGGQLVFGWRLTE